MSVYQHRKPSLADKHKAQAAGKAAPKEAPEPKQTKKAAKK